MVIFKKLRYKNFLSVGDCEIEIDLNSTCSTLVVGHNGAGKCLRGSTEIEIEITNPDVKSKFEEFMKIRKYYDSNNK